MSIGAELGQYILRTPNSKNSEDTVSEGLNRLIRPLDTPNSICFTNCEFGNKCAFLGVRPAS